MRKVQIPARVTRAGVLETRAEDDAVRVVFSTESPVRQYFGLEVLGHGADEIDLSVLRAGGAPVLRDHRRELDAVVGDVVDARVEGGRGVASLRFHSDDAAQAVAAKVRAGELRNVSVGYSIEDMRLTRESDDGDEWRVTRWTPREISLVAVPADPASGVGRAAPDDFVTLKLKEADDMPTDKTTQPAAPAADAKRDAPPAAPATPDDMEARLARAAKDAAAAERDRVSAITETAAAHNVPATMREEAIRGGASLAQFNGAVLSWLGEDASARMNAASAVGLSEREVERFSLVRLIHAQASRNMDLAPFEAEVCDAAANNLDKNRRKGLRGVHIPSDVMGAWLTPAQRAMAGRMAARMGRRDLIVGDKGAGTGGQTVETGLDTANFIDLLRPRVALMRLGARSFDGLAGDVDIPGHAGASTAYWVGENVAPTESTPTMRQVQLKPHTLAAFVNISRRLLLQSSLDVEAFVRDDLTRVAAIELDRCALNGSADADAPDGVADKSVNTVDFAAAAQPTWAEVVDCWTQVAIDNADFGSLAYLMGPAMAGHLMTTPKVAGDASFIMPDMGERRVAGYGAEISTQAAAGDLWFGNWADVLFGFWSGVDLLTDPYSQSTQGAIRVTMFQDTDVNVRHAESFTLGRNIP